MNFLLNDFLDLNKLENKTFVLNKSQFEIKECIQDVIDLYQYNS